MKGKTKQLHKSFKCKKVYKRAQFRKTYTSSYTGSPDSEVIAKYLDKFVFDPSKRETILNHFIANVIQKGNI